MNSKNWCYTLNNYQETDVIYIKEAAERWCTYHIFGREKGSTNHLQGYLCLKRAANLEWLKEKLFYKAHYEIRRGTHAEASEYCQKEGNYSEWGDEPKQGKRSDIERVRELLTDGKGMGDVLQEVNSYQACKFGELYLKYREVKRTWKTNVIWLWGKTGTGKSKEAHERFPNAWCSAGSLQWWDGYDGHDVVIFDDFRADFCKFHELLRIFDRYPYRVQTKGGSRELMAKTIVVTSPFHPEFVYQKNSEDVAQLLRRIEEIVEKK